MNLREYRLTGDWTWIERLMGQFGQDYFWNYLNKVWMALEQLRPGKCYDIEKQVPEDHQELFTKCSSIYIIDNGGCYESGVEFSNDYTKVRKVK